MEFDGDSAGSIESFFSRLQSESSPRNLSQIFEDDLRPMQRESRNLRYQPGGHRAQQSQQPQQPQPQSPPATSPEAVVEHTPSRWSVPFAKIVNIYNDFQKVERMGLALTMFGDNEAATMILYKQKTQTISNTKLKPNGKTIHLQDNYVQFYDDNRKYWSLRFVHQVDEEEFIQTMTTNGWPLEQHSSKSEDDVELQQQQQQDTPTSQDDVEQQQQDTEQLGDQTEELQSDQNSQQFNERIQQKQQQLTEQLRQQLRERLREQEIERNERYRVLHSEQNQERLREQNREQQNEQNREKRTDPTREQRTDPTREKRTDPTREQRRELNQEQRTEQLREQNRELNRQQHREQNLEQLREQNREQRNVRNREQQTEQIRELRTEQNREQLREQNREQLRGQSHDQLMEQNRQRNVRNMELWIEQNRKQLKEQKRMGESPADHQEPIRQACGHRRQVRKNEEHLEAPPQPMPRSRNLATSQEEPSESSTSYMECLHHHFLNLDCEHMEPAGEQISEEDMGCEHMQPVREQIAEQDVIVTPVSIPIGSSTSIENHCSSASAVVQLPARRAESTCCSLLTNFINNHMGPGEIADMKMQNILDAMQRVSNGHLGNFNDDQDEGAPQPQPRTSKAEDAEDRVLQLEEILLNAKKENRRLTKELKRRDEDLLSFQKSTLALMEKLMISNEDLTDRNSRLVETIMSSTRATKKNCINCERSAQEIVFLKNHITALELALRESD